MPQNYASSGSTPIMRGPMGAAHYTSVHNLVFRDRRLSAKAMGLFAHLSTHSGDTPITEETLVAAMRDGRDAIRSGLRELAEAQYLVRVTSDDAEDFSPRQVWYVTDLPAQIRATGVTDPAVILAQVRAVLLAWQHTRQQPPTNNPALMGLLEAPLLLPPMDKLREAAKLMQRDIPDAHTSPAPSHDSPGLFNREADDIAPPSTSSKVLEALFDEFYQSYPRKVGRKEAQRKFVKAVKDGADPRHIIDGSRLYAEAMSGQSDKYVAYPATWLNQGRWLDQNPQPEEQNRMAPSGPFRNYEDQSVYDQSM